MFRLADSKIRFTSEEFDVPRFKMQALGWSQITPMPAFLIWRHYTIIRYNEGVIVDLNHIASWPDFVAVIKFLGTFSKPPWHRVHDFRVFDESGWHVERIHII